MCVSKRHQLRISLIIHINLQTITGNGILDLVTGIWTKFKLGTGISQNLGWVLGVGTPLHDPLLTFQAN